MPKTLDDYTGTCKAEVFGERVIERFKNFRAEIESNGVMDVVQRNYRQYHNEAADGEGLGGDDSFSIMGDNGEILSVRVNESRNLITNALNLTYSQPVGLRAVAKSSDPEALKAAQIANTTLTEDFKASGGGKVMRENGEMALVCTTGFADPEWDLFAGEAYVPDSEQSMSYTGAPKLSSRWVDEVCFDLTKRRWEDVEQAIVLQRANRYLLASQIPDQADKILSVPSIGDSEFASTRYEDKDSDDIIVLRYQHRNGNSRFLPSGRYGLVLEDATVLRDGDSPYSIVDGGRLGIVPITAAGGMGSVYGYPIMNDLSPLQQWLNLVSTMIATLIAGYGAPNIAGPALGQVDIQQLVGGGRYFGMKQADAKVSALNLLPDLKPLFELVQAISSFGEKLSGMNSVVRGGAERDMSGKAVALWKSMAVQFMSSFMQGNIEQHESVGSYTIQLREKFATGEQTAAIVGQDNVQQMIKYKAGETFAHIAKVRAEAVDPAAMTFEGREERANFLLQQGAFTNKQEYLMFLQTGRDEPLYRAEMAQLNLIARENSELMDGKLSPVMEFDNHDQHRPEHQALVAEPNVRNNPAVMGVVLEHDAMHALFQMGISPLQGMDPMSGQPYPSATEQLAQAKAEAAQQQAMMAQQSMTQAPAQGSVSSTEPPAGGSASSSTAGPPAPSGPPAQTMQETMQQKAMGPQ